MAGHDNVAIITEFIAPGNLQVVLKKSSEFKLEWDQRVQMAKDAACGVTYLHWHSPSIIHRDLKSSNLLVTPDMRVKVGDFGASRVIVPSGMMSCCGTPVYMAPEVPESENPHCPTRQLTSLRLFCAPHFFLPC